MPTISPFVQNLVRDARLSPADVNTLKNAIVSGHATVADVEFLASRYANAFEAGVGTAIRDLLTAHGRPSTFTAPRANLAAAPALLNGSVSLSDTTNRKHATVATFQQGLMALASRTQQTAYMLPKYGADGDYGTETVNAVTAFQRDNGIVDIEGKPTGVVDLRTAQKLDQLLRATRVPPIFAGQVDVSVGALMTKAALDLVRIKPASYGVPNAWINHDPRHAITAWYGRPVGQPVNALKDKWKCNLFACGVMVAAGFEPPYYRAPNKPTNQGEYPNANQLFKWSDAHAARNGNRDFVRFALLGEVTKMDTLSEADKETRIKALMATIKPGDMVICDHLGTDVADGGHCRVATKINTDGTVDFAQASQSQAEVQTETWRDLANEEAIWVLRPNKKRPEGATPLG